MAQVLPILPQDTTKVTPEAQHHIQKLPTVQALDALWQRVAQRPLYAPPNFWRYLKLRRRTRLGIKSPATATVLAPDGKVNDCGGCTDICCVGAKSTVLLRLRDIAMLKDIQRTDLISHAKPDFDGETLKGHPALRRHTQSTAWRQFPVLAKDNMGACMALDKAGQCGLFPFWPLSCARFPYAYNPEQHEIFYSARCQSFWIHPHKKVEATAMALQAVVAYNERIKDQVLLAYAPDELADLGVTQFLAE